MKQSEAKFKSIFSPFLLFFTFSTFFRFFHFFCLIFVSLRFFCLSFAYFTLIFASDFWCFASKWIMWNQAFFRFLANKIFASIQISLPKRKWGRTLMLNNRNYRVPHRLNMDLDIQSLFWRLCTAVLIGWEKATPPSPAFGLIYEGAIGLPR